MQNKNSQISLFIIIGILVLISFGVLFYYTTLSNQKIQGAKVDVNYERNSVNLYIKECIIQAAKPLIYEIAGKGGAFNPDSGIIWNGTELNTLAIYKTGTGYENTLLLRQDIENELAGHISNNLKNCINFSIFKEKGYAIKSGEYKIKTALNDKALTILLDYPLEFTIGSTKLNFEDFSITLDTSLGLLYRASIDIVNSEVQDGYFDKEDFILRHEGLMIEKHKPYPNMIYVLREKEQIGKDLAFRFAIKGKDTVGKEVLRYANSFGCCTSKTDGVCFKNTNPSKCADNIYNNDMNCECETNLKSEAEGCCVSGSNEDMCSITTEAQCSQENGKLYKKDFRCSKSKCSNWDCKSTYNYVKDDFSGQAKRHGESWCSYEGIAGRGLDYVGTRHYLHSCIRGKEYAEECRDFREELCAEGVIGVYDKLYSKGLCRLNRWYDCSQQKDKASCKDEEHRDCYWFEGLNSQLKCHPEVPPGLKFWEPNANEICNTASLDKDDEGKKYPRSWGHSTLLYCQRTGDCGNYRNYADEITAFGYYNRDGTPEQWAYLDNGYVKRGDEFAVKLSLYSNYISDSASIPKGASGKYARCDLWQAPAYGNCGLCMNSKLHPCTEYRCKSLGRNCNFDSVTNKCYHGASSAGSSRPNLSITLQGELNSRNTASDYYANATEHAVESAIPVHKPFNFHFRTSKPTRCKISLYPPNVNPNSLSNLIVSLPEILLNDYGYKQDYNVTIRFPSSKFTRLSAYKMFIRCEDQLGIRNDESILVVKTTEMVNDTEAPEIIEVRAQSPLVRNSNNAFSIFVNEPFNKCKYSFNEGDYANMTDLNCSTEERDVLYEVNKPLGSYICDSEIDIPDGTDAVKISCEDKSNNIGTFNYNTS